MYIAPRPVPAFVGHTYYTYQPLMPHEFMYPHWKSYRKYYDEGRGFTRTMTRYHTTPVVNAFKRLKHVIELPR